MTKHLVTHLRVPALMCSPEDAHSFLSHWQTAVSRNNYAWRASGIRGRFLPDTRITHLVFKPEASALQSTLACSVSPGSLSRLWILHPAPGVTSSATGSGMDTPCRGPWTQPCCHALILMSRHMSVTQRWARRPALTCLSHTCHKLSRRSFRRSADDVDPPQSVGKYRLCGGTVNLSVTYQVTEWKVTFTPHLCSSCDWSAWVKLFTNVSLCVDVNGRVKPTD